MITKHNCKHCVYVKHIKIEIADQLYEEHLHCKNNNSINYERIKSYEDIKEFDCKDFRM